MLQLTQNFNMSALEESDRQPVKYKAINVAIGNSKDFDHQHMRGALTALLHFCEVLGDNYQLGVFPVNCDGAVNHTTQFNDIYIVVWGVEADIDQAATICTCYIEFTKAD
ncbi:MAG: hypothetical protein SGARI_007605 [Bacillariaceae sp.]